MALDRRLALERVASEGDPWQVWRGELLADPGPSDPPAIPAQDAEGGFIGPGGRPSPGATGEALCHLKLLGLSDSGQSAIAADWLDEVRTPAGAWLDSPDEIPGELNDLAAPRVWATAAAAAGLLVAGRDPGPRALNLLSGESDQQGRFTGGGYPTFAAAAAFWLGQGPKTEISEWALRWSREEGEEWWGPWERASALTFWLAAGIPSDHPSVQVFLEDLRKDSPDSGWPDDLGLTLRTLEVLFLVDG
jgi:hypothetical protein